MSLPNSLPNPMFDPSTTGQMPAVRVPAPDEMLVRSAPREVRPLSPLELPDLYADHERPGEVPTLDDLAGDWLAKYRPEDRVAFHDEAGEPLPAPVLMPVPAPRLRTWTLPNGKFALVFDRAPWANNGQDDAEDKQMRLLRDQTGAAAVLAYAREVEVYDADVLVEDVPAGARAADEALVRHLREFATDELARLRSEVDTMRADAVRVNAEHEAATRDLDEALERMRRTRELALASGYSSIVSALTLPEEGDEPAAEVAA